MVKLHQNKKSKKSKILEMQYCKYLKNNLIQYKFKTNQTILNYENLKKFDVAVNKIRDQTNKIFQY
jgi:hypothetical protein